jgi:TPR repeat protein
VAGKDLEKTRTAALVPSLTVPSAKSTRRPSSVGKRATKDRYVLRFTGPTTPAGKDDAETVKWYRKAAKQGFAEAQNNLGLMCRQGRGVPRDDAEAVKWFRKAAEQGYGPAQNNLAEMRRQGRGVQGDK